MRKKLALEERAPFGAVTVNRGMGNYLQRLELFEKAIQAYDVALYWNPSDVRSLLGRSLARVKAIHFKGALVDAAKATELEPQNATAKQIRAQTEYERSAFERSLRIARAGVRTRRCPTDFADCAAHAEETIRDCVGRSAAPVLALVGGARAQAEAELDRLNEDRPPPPARVARMQPTPTLQVEETTRLQRQKHERIARLMSSKYLERMAHDKYFLSALCRDPRVASANKSGSETIQVLADNALMDLEQRQRALRERQPLYAARAAELAARARLGRGYREWLERTQQQNLTDATRLLRAVQTQLEARQTARCLEAAEFALEQINKKPSSLFPGKEKFMKNIFDMIAQAFLDQKRVREDMSESDRERRAFAMLGLALSREPSRDSVLRAKPPTPPFDVKSRVHKLERSLALCARAWERCYVLHELSRLHQDTKKAPKSRYYAYKCQKDARATGQREWLLNATWLLARGHVQQNNRPEARAALLEGVALAKSYEMWDVAAYFDTCANVSTEGELAHEEATVEHREKEMVSLMQDSDLKAAAQNLFRRMSTIPAARRFSVMPGSRPEESAAAAAAAGRRVSIMPKAQQQPTKVTRSVKMPLGYQIFD